MIDVNVRKPPAPGADVEPDDTRPIKSRKQAERWLERGVARLAQLQEKLHAQDS